MMKILVYLLGVTLIFLLIPHNALAWDFENPLFSGFNSFHHWGQSFDGYPNNNGYQAGISDAIYDHNQGLVYNPYPQCCHSELYRHAFQEGYDQQWNTYQSQKQQTDQRSNIYINNSPGAYVNTEQNNNQDQGRQQYPQTEGFPILPEHRGDCGCGGGPDP